MDLREDSGVQAERSRSRSKDSNRSGNFRGRGRGGRGDNRGYRRRRRSDSGSSSSSSSDRSNERVRLVAREEEKYLNARVFVANIISKECKQSELTHHFEKYGNVVDLLIHPKNYAFIQYLKEDHAKAAVKGEHGGFFGSWRLDVKMANEGRRGQQGGGRGRGRGRGGFGGDADRGLGRGRSPPRDDPFGDPFRSGGPRRSMPPFPGEFGMRDPYYPPPDPYRRGYPDPWQPPPDDPYRRDPYLEPFRDPYSAPVAAKPPPIECQIFLVSPQLRSYGETIEDRVKAKSIITGVTVMPEGRTAPEMLEDLAQRDGLFAVFVNAQNETHRSLTLNILHGTPQEHRNMPLNDAITLIGRSFEQYVDTLREKANKGAGKPEGKSFLSPTQEVTYLLNLLADNRALTVDELTLVINYLENRKDKLVEIEGPPPASQAMPSSEEITNKILSIFSSAGGTLQGTGPSSSSSTSQQAPPRPPASAPPPPPPPPPPQSSSAQPDRPTTTPQSSASPSTNNLINFDNPNVQAALDNLIQSSPALMKNFNNGAGGPMPPHGHPMSGASHSPRDGNPGPPGGPGGPQEHYGNAAAAAMMQQQHPGYRGMLGGYNPPGPPHGY